MIDVLLPSPLHDPAMVAEMREHLSALTCETWRGRGGRSADCRSGTLRLEPTPRRNRMELRWTSFRGSSWNLAMPWDPGVLGDDHAAAVAAAVPMLDACVPTGDPDELAHWGLGLMTLLHGDDEPVEMIEFDGPFGGFSVGSFRGWRCEHPLVEQARRLAPSAMSVDCRLSINGGRANTPDVSIGPVSATSRRTSMARSIVCDPLANSVTTLRAVAFVREKLGI